MCTLLVWKHIDPRYPLIVAANRDEFLDRPTAGPQLLWPDPVVVGGRDEVAGGTWLAVSERRLIVALTNRKNAGKHDPTKASRGTLVLELARLARLDEVVRTLERVDAADYNPFVLLAAQPHRAVTAHSGADGLRVDELPDGPHAVTNWDLDADAPATAAHSKALARDFGATRHRYGELPERLWTLLQDHGDPSAGVEGCCVHQPERRYGTRSSSIVLLAERPEDCRAFHLEGHPCEGRFEEISALVWKREPARRRVEP